MPPRTSIPRLLRWDLVSSCNLSCSHCSVGPMLRDETTRDLAYDQVIEGLESAARAGVAQVHFLGGEPTIRKDFLQICRAARGFGLEVSFNTNGIRQDERYIKEIIDLSIKAVTVSIDGPDAETHDAIRGMGSFSKARGFVKKLVEAKKTAPETRGAPIVQIQSVLTRNWMNRCREMVELASRWGANALVVNSLAKVGDAITSAGELSLDHADTFRASIGLLQAAAEHQNLLLTAPIRLKVLQYYRLSTGDRSYPVEMTDCPAMTDNIQVSHDGALSPCQLATEQGLGTGKPAQSLLDGDLDAAMRSGAFAEFHTDVKADINRTYRDQVPCNRCHFLGNGCRPCPIGDSPDVFKTNYQCLFAEQLISLAKISGRFERVGSHEFEKILENVVQLNPIRKRPHGIRMFSPAPSRVFPIRPV